MGYSAWTLALIATTTTASPIEETEVETNEAVFQDLWNEDFDWKLDRLPTKGTVAKERIPYSGYIYLDKFGGTSRVLRKYDAAVNNRSYPATSWEYSDTSAATTTRTIRTGRGFFSRTITVGGVNHWYGHCNGWASAAIRHAEPRHSVMAYGTEFTPADIKGMLAEIYMYNEHQMLAGFKQYLNPGALHAILANWIGRGSHPVVMDGDPSKEKWNYPIYSFASSYRARSAREVEVRTAILYAKDSDDREHNRSPRISKKKSFHYMLELDPRGEITGGYYFTDSDRIDFIWIPLSPKASGEEGNERGNPHLDVNKVLAIWRKSVPREIRRRWLVVDPTEKDRAVEVADPTVLLPRNIRIVPPTVPADALAGDTR